MDLISSNKHQYSDCIQSLSVNSNVMNLQCQHVHKAFKKTINKVPNFHAGFTHFQIYNLGFYLLLPNSELRETCKDTTKASV